jgi:TolB protein
VEPLTDNDAADGSPRYSPDGHWLAFDSFRDGNYEIYLLELVTRGLTRVTFNTWFDGSPDWVP